MQLSLFAKGLELTPRIESYVQKKTGRLDRYMPNLAEVRVDLTEQNTRSALERQIAQITVRDDRGTILRAEERSNDLFAAIDAVVDKLYRQISRYRGKRRQRRRAGTAPEELAGGEPLPLEFEEEETSGEEGSAIVRRKKFLLRPMSTEEAIDQMILLGHDFFVFFNAEEEAINVIYRRRDSTYGLLQPEME